MENRGSKASMVTAVFIVVVGLLMAARGSDGCDPGCYEKCFLDCITTLYPIPAWCSFQCLSKCGPCSTQTPDKFGGSESMDSEYFCKLGCSVSKCTHLSTKTDPATKEVSGCVDSCSGICSKH